MALRARVLQIAFSLVLGSVLTAVAQTNDGHPYGMPPAASDCGPEGDSTNRCVSVGILTIQPLALRSFPAAKSDLDPEFSYSIPPIQERGVTELNEPSLTTSAHLADPALAAYPQGWRIGGAGALGYTARNQRWRFVIGYAPDLGALREDFGRSHSFSLVWQYSLGKHKPAGWAGVTTGSEHLRRPAAR